MIDCFAYQNGRCIAFDVKKCPLETITDGCCFQKTQAEHIASVRRKYTRLGRLSRKKQDKIAGMYYNGKMPWKEGGNEQ